MRRFLDIFIVLLLTPIILPLLLIAILLKFILDGRPIFYLSKRLGKGGRHFLVFKFRTMIVDANIIQREIKKYNDGGFEAIPISSAVYTPLGRYFEKFQLVEMPQIFNVLNGQMSFVGYRPLPYSHIEKLSSQLGSSIVDKRQSSTPGITGFAQLIGKANLTPFERISVEINEAAFFDKKGNSITKFLVYFYLLLSTGMLLIFRRAPFINRIYSTFIK